MRRLFHREFFVSRERTELALAAAKASLAAEQKLEKDDISLYVGIPFCPTRCAYCSFVSTDVQRALKLVEPYLAALDREIDAVAEYLPQAGGKGAHHLYRRGHPHHPERRAAGASDLPPAPEAGPVPAGGVHRGGRAAGHHHGGEDGGAGATWGWTGCRSTPRACGRGVKGHGALPHGLGYFERL